MRILERLDNLDFPNEFNLKEGRLVGNNSDK